MEHLLSSIPAPKPATFPALRPAPELSPTGEEQWVLRSQLIHMIPPPTRDAPIRVPYFRHVGLDDLNEDGQLQEHETDDAMRQARNQRCQELCSKITEMRTRGNAATYHEQIPAWQAFLNDDLLGLCEYLIDTYWLGLLRDFLGRDILNDNDFFDENEASPFGLFLTTHTLESYLRWWKERIEQLDDDPRAAEDARIVDLLDRTGQIINSLFRFLEHMYRFVAPDHFRDWDPLGMTHFACTLMLQALFHARSKVILERRELGSVGSMGPRLPWLKRKMELDGWCPFTIRRLFTSWNVDELAIAYSVETVRIEDNHASCTDQACVANNTNDSALAPPRHICTRPEECGFYEIPVEELVGIIKSDGLPVLAITAGEDAHAEIEVRPADDNTPYIALSHVWADRLGTPKSNSIANCQLLRLAVCLKALAADQFCDNLCIWIDSLCIPIGLGYQDLRNSQISKMTSIYKDAFAVLVMDEDTLRIEPSDSFVEAAILLSISSWSQRLWTYQEGMLNDHLLVMASMGLDIIDIDAEVNAAVLRDPGKDHLQHYLIDKAIRLATLTWGRPHPSGRKSGAVDVALAPKESYSLMNHSRHSGDLVAQRLLHSIYDRTSTRLDDETVIIASGLGLPVAPILAAPADRRMNALIKSMDHVPANLLFTIGPRLLSHGLRWAPQSLLCVKGGHALTVVEHMVPWDKEKSMANAAAMRPKSILSPDGDGLLTFNPALLLKAVYQSDPRHPQVSILLDDLIYSFHDASVARADIQSVITMLAERKVLAILLPEFYPERYFKCGVIVEVLEEPDEAVDVETLEPTTDIATKVKFCMSVIMEPKQKKDVVYSAESGVEVNEYQMQQYAAEWLWPKWWLVD